MRNRPNESPNVPAWMMRAALLLFLKFLPGCGESPNPHVKWDLTQDGATATTSTGDAECLRFSGDLAGRHRAGIPPLDPKGDLLRCTLAVDPMTGKEIPCSEAKPKGEAWCAPETPKAPCKPQPPKVKEPFTVVLEPGEAFTTCEKECWQRRERCNNALTEEGYPAGKETHLKNGAQVSCEESAVPCP